MDNNLIAAGWIGLALLASLISIRSGISASLLEVLLGVAAANFLGLLTSSPINFLAGFGSVVLVFLAGAEIDITVLRSKLKEGVLIGFFSFLVPFLAAFAFTQLVLGWSLSSANIAGLILSCTSVAVVYTVMVETGLNSTDLGKTILVACFFTNFITVIALSIVSADFDGWLLVFILVLVLALVGLPRFTRWFFKNFTGHMSEPETRYIFLILFALGGLATLAKSQTVLPAYLVGIALGGVFMKDPALVQRTRSIAFAFLTPFFFLKAGFHVSLPAIISGAGVIALLLALRMVAKFVGVFPVTKLLGFRHRERAYTTLLMSTGLTFDIIIALYGLDHNLIDGNQYAILVSMVIASAVIPTIVAQTFFKPESEKDVNPLKGIPVGENIDIPEPITASESKVKS